MSKAKFELGIFGWPVRHTLSPTMHHAAADALGISLHYRAIPVKSDELPDAIERIRKEDMRGVNLTLPHKEEALSLVDEIDVSAALIGAVNTIVNDKGVLKGFNTDGIGVVRALEEAGVSIAGKKFVIVGAGGAARSCVVALSQHGAIEITITARRQEQAQALIKEFSEKLQTELKVLPIDEIQDVLPNTDALIQATSATLDQGAEADAFAESLHLQALPKHAAVMDLVYAPLETSVLKNAAQLDLKTIDGLGMLLHQGVRAFELWTGSTPPLDVMRNALVAAL